jgi:hypothetical protein
LIVPADNGETDLEPFVACNPDQSLSLGLAEDVQDVVFVVDQVNPTLCPTVTTLGDAKIVTVGKGGGLPLLPPQALHRNAPRNPIEKSWDLLIMVSSSAGKTIRSCWS